MAWFRKQGYPLNLVVNLDVPDEVILARISDRWVHLPSGRVYSLSYKRPRVDGLDDETGEPLTKRPDDNPVRHRGVIPIQYSIASSFFLTTHGFGLSHLQEVFSRRLRQFYSTTSPLLQFYNSSQSSPSPGSKAKLVSLRGSTSDEIWPLLEHAVRSTIPSLKERGGERRRAAFSEVVLASDEERGLHERSTRDARRT